MRVTKNETNKAVLNRKRKVKDQLWAGDAETIQDDIEDVESQIGFKLNPQKALWVYAQLHQLDLDVYFKRVEPVLVGMMHVASKAMVNEEFAPKRAEIEGLINETKWIYEWFRRFTDYQVLSPMPRS